MKFFCLKCKNHSDLDNFREETTKRGMKIAKAECPNCKTTMCRMLGKN